MRHREVRLREVETQRQGGWDKAGGKKTYTTDNTKYSADSKMNTRMQKQCQRYPQVYVLGEGCHRPHFLQLLKLSNSSRLFLTLGLLTFSTI